MKTSLHIDEHSYMEQGSPAKISNIFSKNILMKTSLSMDEHSYMEQGSPAKISNIFSKTYSYEDIFIYGWTFIYGAGQSGKAELEPD